MTAIWNKIAELASTIENKFKDSGEILHTGQDLHEFNWYNSLYQSNRYRRAHVEIVDKKAQYGIYILHSTVFPHFNDCSPIWGFDAICGANKITGAFHDFSSGGDPEHFMMQWFSENTKNLNWTKPRELPEWARQIFSPSMIAAGNIKDLTEIDLLCSTVIKTLDYYLNFVGTSQQSFSDFHMAQNRYCHYQKLNPQVEKSMIAMGVDQHIISKFMDKILFPETW